MASFRNLKDLENYIKNNVPKQILSERKVENVLKNAMREAVQEIVYDAYTPNQYVRRGANGGLLDIEVMRITDAFVSGDAFNIIFKNVAEGNDTLASSEDGELANVIINGIENAWQRTGVWSQPRDFVADTVRRICASDALLEAIKISFRKVGFKVK